MSRSSYNPFGLSFVRQGRRCLKYLREGNYRKIPKISPRAYIFQRPFLRGLFSEGLYLEGLIYSYSLKEIYRFLLCFTLYLRAISKYKPPWRAFILEILLKEIFDVNDVKAATLVF